MTALRSWRTWLAIPLLSIVFALVLGEGLLRIYYHLVPPTNYHLIPPSESMLHIFLPSDKGTFYTVKPNYRQKFIRDDFNIAVRTNNIGLREDSDYHGEPVDIGFIGDSFTFGWGVEAGERYSDVVRAAFPGKRVLSYSYPNGHAPINYLAFLQDHPEMMPRILVLGLFPFNDLAEETADAIVEINPDSGKIMRVGSKTTAVDDRGFIYIKNQPLPDTMSWQGLMRRTAIGRTINVARQTPAINAKPAAKPKTLKPLDEGQFDETAQLALDYVKALDKMTRDNGSTLLVFYIPFANWAGNYQFCQYAAETCERMQHTNSLGDALTSWTTQYGIPFIDPTMQFRKREAAGQRLYFEFDAHWTPAGHAAAGKLITEYLRANEDTFSPKNSGTRNTVRVK
jgi:hypothetical protein